jgi:hypothetical protein
VMPPRSGAGPGSAEYGASANYEPHYARHEHHTQAPRPLMPHPPPPARPLDRDLERCRVDVPLLQARVRQGDPRPSRSGSVRDPHGAVEDKTSAALFQLDAHPNRLVARLARREFDLSDGMHVFRNPPDFRSHRGAQPGGMQLDGQVARLARAETLRAGFLAEGESPRPIEMKDRRVSRAGRDTQRSPLAMPGLGVDGDLERFLLEELNPVSVVPVRARHLLAHIEPLDLGATRENRLFAQLPTARLELPHHFHVGAFLEIAINLSGSDPLTGVGQVAVAVPIQIENVTVEHYLDTRLGLWSEDQQAVLGLLRFISRLLAQRAIDLRQIDSPSLTGEGQAYPHREEVEAMHVHLLPEAELVILSRKRADNDGPKSAGQSANFQMR